MKSPPNSWVAETGPCLLGSEALGVVALLLFRHPVKDERASAVSRWERVRLSPPAPNRQEGSRMFTYKLELEDGTPADPPTFTTSGR